MQSFYWRWIKTVLTPSLGPIDLCIGLAVALLGFIDHYVPQAQLMTAYGWQIPVWAVAAVIAMRLLLAPYWMHKELNAKLAKIEGLKTILEISGPHLLQDDHGHYKWRFRARNRGSKTADNVQMRLRAVTPLPRDPLWHADYPYPVARVGKTFDEPPSRINAGDEEDYEMWTWRGSDGLFYASLNTKAAVGNTISIEQDEAWELKYELTAENADRVHFSMQVRVRDGVVLVERKQ